MDARFIKLLSNNILNRKSIYLELQRINALKIPNEKERVLYFYLKNKITELEKRIEGIFKTNNEDLFPLAFELSIEIKALESEIKSLVTNNPEITKPLKIFNHYDRLREVYTFSNYRLQKACHHPIKDTKIIEGEYSGYALRPCLLCGKFDTYYYEYESLIKNELSIKDIDLELKDILTKEEKEFLILDSVSGNKEEKEIYRKRLIK
jgi:hypothetical protein